LVFGTEKGTRVGRREELLNAVREHALPLGPYGDPDERDRLEREWQDSLTEDDCLELLGWLRESDWSASADRWTRKIARQIPNHVGRAGRRCRGSRLLALLLDLLCDPQRCELAFDALYGLEESAEYDNLLVGTPAGVVPINAELAQVATPAQTEQLRRVACSPDHREDVRSAVRDILRGITLLRGTPSQFTRFSPDWRTDTARAIAGQMAASRDFGALPILADALQDAGCDNADILDHCRGHQEGVLGEPVGGSPVRTGPHVRGCWVVDLVLGKA
jgi:hypothetical protein